MKSDRHFGLVNRGHRGFKENTVRRTDISGLVITTIHVTFFSVAYVKLSYGKMINALL